MKAAFAALACGALLVGCGSDAGGIGGPNNEPADQASVFGDPISLPFGRLDKPGPIAVSPAGIVFAGDETDARVLALGATGDAREVALSSVGKLGGLAAGAGEELFVSDPRNDRIVEVPADYIKNGSGRTRTVSIDDLNNPAALTVDQNQSLLIVDTGTSGGDSNADRVLVLAKGSDYTEAAPWDVQSAVGVGTDSSGAVYVALADAHSVRKFPPKVETPVELLLPAGVTPKAIAVKPDGHVYVADGSAGIWAFAPDSTNAQRIDIAGMQISAGVAVDRLGNLYVTDAGNRKVVKLPVK